MTTPNTPTVAQSDAWRKLADAATPGPWEEVAESGEWWITGPDIFNDVVMTSDASEISQADADFICAARAAVPALLAEVERLRAILAYIDIHAPLADVTCAEPGITLSEAARRALAE